MIGKTIGQYEITGVLGKGGMATVYRATQRSMERDVAIKVMSSEITASEEFIQRFEREAKIFAVLQHPHILPVIDFGSLEDNLYIVMRMVDGGTLDKRIESEGRLSLSLVGKLAEQIGNALSFAHGKGIVHRDLKPSNILLDDDDNAYLTDFGIAKMVEGSAKLTATNAVMGTPAYMSPEQWRGENIDLRTDVYSMGILIYEMVTGKMPFESDTTYSFMYKHMSEPPIKPTEHIPDIPLELEKAILQALEKEPGDRYQSTQLLGETVRAITSGAPNIPTPESYTHASTTADAVGDDDIKTVIGLQPNDATMSVQNDTHPTMNITPARIAKADAMAVPRPDTDTVEPTAKRPTWLPIAGGVVALVIIGVILALVIGGGDSTDDNQDTSNVVDENTIDLSSLPYRLAINRESTESWDVYTMRPDGTDLQFVNTGGKPSWSPDGSTVAFDSEFTGNPELFTIGVNDFTMQNITQNPSADYFAAYSPDGSTISFHTNRDGDFNIYLMDADGGNVRQLTDNVASDQWSSWSPDGSQILFSSQRDGNFEIYSIAPDGTNLQRLTENPGADIWAAWSPDGSQIVFQSNRDGNLEIYVMDADGSNVIRLTDNEADDQWPDWSPSEFITFVSNRDGNLEIYVIRPDGTGLTRVTETESNERYPVWAIAEPSTD